MPSLLDNHVGPESIADIQNAYFEDNMPKTWYDAARKYPKSIFASYILAKNRIKDRPRSHKHTFNLKVGSNNSVRATGLFDKVAPPRTDLSIKGVRELKQLCVVSNERTVKISGVEHEGITTCPELHRTFEESTG